MDNTNLNPSYTQFRSDIFKLVPKGVTKVLDVGCSNGLLGKEIKDAYQAEVVGIEINQSAANIATNYLDKVLIGDVEKIIYGEELTPEYFDCIIYGDVLEHLIDPWTLLKKSTGLLKPNGFVVVSLPNIRFFDTFIQIFIRGRWPYRERGIFDKTHLRQFTRKNILELFYGANLTIEKINANYRIVEQPHSMNNYAYLLALPGIRDFLAFQYLILGRKIQDG